MSVRRALDAIDACDRLGRGLLDAIDRHRYAATLARPDWQGPHRDEFDDRFASAQRRLQDSEQWLLVIRRQAEQALVEALEQQRAVMRVPGPW